MVAVIQIVRGAMLALDGINWKIGLTEGIEYPVARQRKLDTDLQGLACLSGPRLLLRPPRMTDARAVYAYASDPEVTRYLAWPRHRSLEESECFLRKAITDWQSGHNLVWLIEQDGAVVGSIGAMIRAPNAGIGYLLSRTCWGKGYASEALQAVCEALSLHSAVRDLWAQCVTDNPASARVLEKEGFRVVRMQKAYFACPNCGGELKDVVLFSRILEHTQSGSMRHRPL